MPIRAQLVAATLLAGFLITGCTTASRQGNAVPQANTTTLQSFEFLGCAGDWPVGDSSNAEVRRLTANDRVTFLVRHSGTCGLEGRNPKARLADGVLDLHYELFSPRDAVVMCECEYWARFTFGSDAAMISRVRFDGQPTTLIGEWPKTR